MTDKNGLEKLGETEIAFTTSKFSYLFAHSIKVINKIYRIFLPNVTVNKNCSKLGLFFLNKTPLISY